MKTIIIAFIAVLCSITVSAQEFTVKSSSHGFNMENSTKTSQIKLQTLKTYNYELSTN